MLNDPIRLDRADAFVLITTLYNHGYPEGDLVDPTAAEAAAKTMLDRPAWWAEALRRDRSERPYAA